jgi:hypothetical protein
MGSPWKQWLPWGGASEASARNGYQSGTARSHPACSVARLSNSGQTSPPVLPGGEVCQVRYCSLKMHFPPHGLVAFPVRRNVSV